MKSRHLDLLPFDEVADRLRLTDRTYLGIQSVPVERVIGSVDRVCQFDRDFRPRRRDSQARLASLRVAFPQGDFPAMSAFEIGGVHLVSDGHHRVALARERGQDFIDAIRRAGLDLDHAEVTQGDVFLLLYQRSDALRLRRRLRFQPGRPRNAVPRRLAPRELRRALHRQAALALR